MDIEFKLNPSLIHVNHAAVAPWPQRTVKSVQAFASENGRQGSRHYEQWLYTEQSLRESLARLINAHSSDEIALLKSTSEGLSLIAKGIAWQAGDNVIISNQEFPSNHIVWDALKNQGVELKIANIGDAEDPEQALIEQMDENTRLLSISAVQYASGLKMDLARLGEACHSRGILYCVDAIQQIGALQFDVQAIQADFVVADGHKWMLGPEGLALFYCKQSRQNELALQQFGWHMVDDLSDYSAMTDWKPANNARRFECGSPNMLGIHALHSSVGLLLERGMQAIENKVLENVQLLIKHFQSLAGIEVLSPTDIQRHAGIFTFKKQGLDNQTLYNELVSRGVLCASRGGGIRFSPHYYNTEAQFAQLAEWVNSIE